MESPTFVQELKRIEHLVWSRASHFERLDIVLQHIFEIGVCCWIFRVEDSTSARLHIAYRRLINNNP